MNLKFRKTTFVVGVCSMLGLMYAPQAKAVDTQSVSPAVQQSKKVTGRVNDSQGPLIGATVMVKGTSNGVVTDIDGNFNLNAAPGSTLVISYVGYVTQEITVGNQSFISVNLKEEGRVLNDVVVIGYGTQRKEAVTGSVASVKGDMLREVPAGDVTNALQGRVAGVQMMQTSSKPGASMQIRVRGSRSLTASNDPLIVLDGIPFAGTISDIDPNNIKAMDILKDASATAIYGSRGANGVIMITTYKGMQDQEPVVKYNMYVGFKKNFARYPMMNGDQLKRLREVSGLYQPVYTNGDEEEGMNTDWQDMLFKTAFTTNQDLSVSGGTAKSAYNVGISYFKDEATIPTQNFKRYAMHAALDQEIGKYLKVGFSTNTNYSITNNANLGIYNTLSCSPLINPYNADGTLKPVVHMEKDNQWTYTRDRIENLGDSYKDQTTGLGTYNNFYGEIKCPWVNGLKYRVNLGLNYRHNKNGSYTGTGVFSDSPSANSGAGNGNSTMWNWAIEHMLTYDKTFGDHTINAVALYSAEKNHYESTYMSASQLFDDRLLWYNLGYSESTSINPGNQNYNESGLVSMMARVMYSYKDRYMISATVRQDKSSRLAPGHRVHTYPAVSLGWNIAKENFMQNVKWVDNLKLRAGYGETSNQSVDPYKTLGRLASRPYNFGPTGYATGFYVSELPNEELGWEYSQTYNFGVDFSLFNGRLTGTAEYYTQKTKDLLMSVGLPSTSGVGSYMANVGKTENKGFELSLNGVIIDNLNGWTWEAGINWYTNKNKIIELADGSERDEGNGWFVGHSINCVYDYEKIGIWQKDEEELRKIMEPGGSVGMIKVKGGYNEDGTPRAINSSDRQIIELDPSWEGGFNTRVAYKNWDLSAVASFRHGGKLISTLYGSSSYLNMMTGRRNNVDVDYWTEDNPTNKFPNPAGPISNDNPKYGTTLGFFSGSYLKFRTITLGYNFKGDWMKKAGISALRAYATVTNPFVLFSPYHDESGMDPETNSRGNENQAAAAYASKVLVVGFNTPTTRNYLFGLNVTF
jgi:TonB-linked SusC/RagA family outer membrane protein